MKTESFEQIKNRMVKKAASIWGVAPNEIETSFDPVVSLLVSACASEILNIEAELNDSQNRITEKLVSLMTPETAIGVKPAHAILYAETIDTTVTVKPEYLFYYKKRVTQKNASVRRKNIFFSPVQDFKLINAKIGYLATGNSFFQINDKKEKVSLMKRNAKAGALPHSTIYLGLIGGFNKIDLDKVSFYFELTDVDNKSLFFHYLKHSEWFVGDQRITSKPGFSGAKHGDTINLKSIFKNDSNKIFNITSQTLNFYEQHYITLEKHNSKLKKSSCKEMDEFTDLHGIDLPGPVTWIKVVFPSVIPNSTLANLFCSLNAFPVLNRELNSLTYQMRQYINILPLKTDDHFLDIKSIENTNGETYIRKSKSVKRSGKGTFSIRDNNVGKLDNRTASEYLTYLIELLKDESASFSAMNNDFLQTNLNNLNQLISLLEKRVSSSSKHQTETTYVLLDPFRKKESLLVDYWTTNGEEANNIKSGSNIDVYRAIGIKQKGSYLMTTTFDGKDDLTMDERLNAYRRSLLSRDRVVTKEDVKALCYEIYNDKIKNVNVKKGFTNSVDLKKGFVQCIDIELYPKGNVDVETNEWQSLCSNLLMHLEKKSLNIYPYKIKVVN
ncbi:type VI secretion system baseplate subunit TssF [Hyunsoonleella rubra]|uniref:Type VI secretion system baseplate subunit TssF n=1 Tax=Hyunsoonleella rubra TaxID=1737062 RepID=A0ABW5TBW0_9FLAO